MDPMYAIGEIIQQMTEKAKSLQETVSLALVGSFSSETKTAVAINDLDFAFLVKRVTPPILSKVHDIGADLCPRFSDAEIETTFSMQCGPVRNWSEQKLSILIHMLLYDIPRYNLASEIVTYSWQNFSRLLLGVPLEEIKKIDHLTFSHVIDSDFGIEDCSRMIEKREAIYYEWIPYGKNCKYLHRSRNVDGIEFLDLLCYSVLRSASNATRATGKLVDQGIDMISEFEKTFSHLKTRTTPRRFFQCKKLIRTGKKRMCGTLSDDLQKDALEFLSELKNSLELHVRV